MTINSIMRAIASCIKVFRVKILRGDDFETKGLPLLSYDSIIKIHKTGKMKLGRGISASRLFLLASCPNAELIVGNDVHFNTGCEVIAQKKITIGDNVIFGPGCKVYDHDHDYKKLGEERRKNFITKEVVIGNGVWLGANCVVLKGTKIGDNCVFGAGSIIKGDYPENMVVVQQRIEKKIGLTEKITNGDEKIEIISEE